MRIWNLTPHTMVYDDGTQQRTFPSDGVLRLTQLDTAAEPIDGLKTVHSRYLGPEEIPAEIHAGDVVIVSTLVGDAWEPARRPPGVTIIVPDTGASCRRNSEGRIVSVSRFIRK